MHAHGRPQALAKAMKKRSKPPLIETNAEGKEVYRDHRRSVPAHTMFDDMDARPASMNRYGISTAVLSLFGQLQWIERLPVLRQRGARHRRFDQTRSGARAAGRLKGCCRVYADYSK